MNANRQSGRDAEGVAMQLFARFGERLYNTAFLMCRNASDAEDLVMRTIERAVSRFGQFDDTRELFPWLCGILTNFYRMDLRGKGRNALDFMADPPEPTDERPDPAEILAREADACAVQRAVANLPDRYRALVVLRYFDDMTVPQIAAELALPEGTVKRLLHEARQLIRRELTENGAAEANG